MLSKSTLVKLNKLQQRYLELEQLLMTDEVIADNARLANLAKEHADLAGLVELYDALQINQKYRDSNSELLDDADPDLRQLAQHEAQRLEQEHQELEHKIRACLVPTDPNDDCNIFLEIRAATGGDEAAIFAGELAKMYTRYAENNNWQIELIQARPCEVGGYREVILRICGKKVYAKLKFESGTHRVQRVPATESQGRIHTSTCTVAVLPEVERIASVTIDPAELRIDTFRASGAGGQHVNRTDSAVRVIHLPTGVTVECQEGRSQHQNKAKALALLQAKLLQREQSAQQQAIAQQRRDLVGTGERHERIRTYNFPQGRITDHRISLTLYKIEEILAGNLEHLIIPLTHEHQMDLLTADLDD